MKRSIKFLFFSICTLFALQLQAQKGELKLNLQYSYGVPVGSFKNDIISNGSPRGATGDILYNINNKIAVGIGLGYQDFYQKYPRTLYNTGDKEVTSAVLSNSVQIIPMLAKVELLPLGDKKYPVQPYIQVGAGLGSVSFSQYLGEFGSTDNSGGFMLQGGAGVSVAFSAHSNAGFKLGADYNMVGYKRNGFNNLNNLAFKAGIFLPLK
jgi:hypothetical protein